MSSITAHHLPGFAAAGARPSALADTGLLVPQLGPAAGAEIWRGLDAAAAAWRRLGLGERVLRLAEVAAELRARGPGPWAPWLSRSAGLSPAGLGAAWDVTFAPYDRSALLDLLHAEGLDPQSHGDSRWPHRIAHVLAGNVLPPTFAMLVRGWLLGAAQWLRPAGREPLFACALGDALTECAADLAPTFAVLWWPHGDVTEETVLSCADLVTVQGDDASVANLRTRCAGLAPRARFCGYGDRWSLAVLSRRAQTDANAAGVARDVALFDQQGCLSPSLVVVEDGPQAATWCAVLAQALAAEERRAPRGPRTAVEQAGLRAWRESMRLGLALGSVRGFWESARTTAWACALLAPDAPLPEAPLDRHVAVLPFANESACMASLGMPLDRLQGLAADLTGWDSVRERAFLARLAPTRVARPGELQLAPPTWRQDGRAPLGAWIANLEED